MKFRKLRQLAVVSAIGLGVATLFSGCQLVTIDYLFVATSASTVSGSSTSCPNGEIETYAVDSQSGAIRNGAPAVCSGGSTPSVLAVSPGYQNLYVANQDDKNIVHFSLAANGVLTNKDTVTLADPVTAMTVSPDGNSLYVLSGTTSATLSVFGLSSGAIGSAPQSQTSLTIPGNAVDLVVPTGITVLPSGKAIYATAYDKSSYNPGGTTTSSASPGWLYGFVVGSSGALTPTPGSPYNAGVKPSGVVADPLNSYLYVTDFASNQLIGYGVYSGFAVNFLLNGPYKSGGQPTALAIDPRGRFMYVSNSLDSSINRICHRSSDRHTVGCSEHNRFADQQHRYAADCDCSRSCPRPVCVHSEFSGEFGFRFPARSDCWHSEADAGYSLPHRSSSVSGCTRATR